MTAAMKPKIFNNNTNNGYLYAVWSDQDQEGIIWQSSRF
jgi:hypothetical protein